MLSNISREAEAVAAHTLIAENWRNTLDLIMADPVSDQTHIEDLVTATHKPSDMVCTLQKSGFDYF